MSEVNVNSKQLRKAAELVEATEPSVVNGRAEERPAWLRPGKYKGDVVLVVGILPCTTHTIFSDGTTPEDHS